MPFPKLLVFGGRGFLGSAVCAEALKTGLQVVSVSPSGTPPLSREEWVSRVEWTRGNALEPETYSQQLRGAVAVISCVGAFGSNAHMLRVNGDANVRLIEQAKLADVPRFVYISAYLPKIPGLDMALSGYVNGKRKAEAALAATYATGGVVVQPWIIYGDRVVSSSVTLPLGALFGPAEYLLSQLPSRQLSSIPLLGSAFVPPVSAAVVAKAAVQAATDDSFPPGTVDPWQLQQYK